MTSSNATSALALLALITASPRALAFSPIKTPQIFTPVSYLHRFRPPHSAGRVHTAFIAGSWNSFEASKLLQRKFCIPSLGFLSSKKDDQDEDEASSDSEEDGNPFSTDQREGMADAFAALDSLTADDFDDLKPLSSTSSTESKLLGNMEDSAKVFLDMQAELDEKGQQGLYDDILQDLSNDDFSKEKAYTRKKEGEEETTALGDALDQAVLDGASSAPVDNLNGGALLDDTDGIGVKNEPTPLTTSAITNEILTQEVSPSLSMEDFMTRAVQEAVKEVSSVEDFSSQSSSQPSDARASEIAETTNQILEDESVRKEIELIFDRAEQKLKLQVEAMKKEQEILTQNADKQGMEYLELEKQRLTEAEESVSKLIRKVAEETEEVQKAMEDLERVKSQVSVSGDNGGIEDAALNLKKSGLIKQAALVGGLLFGSRAVTETILVLGSMNGDEHALPALLQAVVALVCGAYFFFAK